MSRPIKHWKIIETKILLDYKDFVIVEDTILLPNGKKTTYIRRGSAQNDSVIVIALNNEAKILLQREYSHPPKKVLWQLPGGSIRDNEDILLAANRELSEESGITATNMKNLGYFYINNRLSDQKQHVIVATKLTNQKLLHDDDEFIESHWMNIDAVLTMIAKNEITNINLLAAINIWLNHYRRDV